MLETPGDRPVILVGPDSVSKINSQGQKSVRGRKDRMDLPIPSRRFIHSGTHNIYRVEILPSQNLINSRPRSTQILTMVLVLKYDSKGTILKSMFP
jgi:hypothetical protein